MAVGDVLRAGLSWAGVAAGLLVAVLGDKGIDLAKKQALETAELRAMAYSGHSLTVQPRWFYLWFLLVFFGGMAFLCASAVTSVLSIGKIAATVIFGVLALGFTTCVATISATMYSAVRCGGLVQMDGLGLALWGNKPVPWRQFAGIDLKATDVKGRKRYDLVLALWPNGSAPDKSTDWARRLHWTAPVFDLQMKTLTLPCGFLNIEPHTLAQAMKVIADQFNSVRLKDWRYFETIESASARADERQKFEIESQKQSKLLARLVEISKSPKQDPKEIHAIDQAMGLSMEKSSTLVEATASQSAKDFAYFEVRYKKFKWTILIAVLWIVGVISLTYFLR